MNSTKIQEFDLDPNCGFAKEESVQSVLSAVSGGLAQEETAQEILSKVDDVYTGCRSDDYVIPFSEENALVGVDSEKTATKGQTVTIGTVNNIPLGCTKFKVEFYSKATSASTEGHKLSFSAGGSVVGYVDNIGMSYDYEYGMAIIDAPDLAGYTSLDISMFCNLGTVYCNSVIITPYDPKRVITTEKYEAGTIKDRIFVVNYSSTYTEPLINYYPRLDRTNYETTDEENLVYVDGIPYLCILTNGAKLVVKY